jgi:hypothetical protein
MTTEIKHFTPSEAQRTLPLIKRIVKDILDTSREMRLLADDLGGEIKDNAVIGKMADDIHSFIQEIEEVGCHYKDWNFTIGLVDFPALIYGEEVFLCWRSDEEDIKYYHGIDAGYAGRKLIPKEFL